MFYVLCNILYRADFHGSLFCAYCTTPKSQDHHLSGVRDCLSKIFTVTQVQEDNFHKVSVILRNNLRQSYQALRQAHIKYDYLV